MGARLYSELLAGAETWTPQVFIAYPELDPTNGETRQHFRNFLSSHLHTAPQRRK